MIPADLPFTHRPGWRERHLRRLHLNPLFGWPPRAVAADELLEAQRADAEEQERFRADFMGLIERIMTLAPDVGSEQVLSLKEAVEEQYERSCGLPGDHRQERASLRKLIGAIMRSVRQVAAHDPLARQELAEEEEARNLHFRLLEQPLVADLLRPDSPLGPETLAPALLHATLDELEAVLEIFDPPQLAAIAAQASALIARLEGEAVPLDGARQRLAMLRAAAAAT